MIRFKNTRTGKETKAKDGKDAALLVKIESDRRSGIEAEAQLQTAAERVADMAEANRVQRQAMA